MSNPLRVAAGRVNIHRRFGRPEDDPRVIEARQVYVREFVRVRVRQLTRGLPPPSRDEAAALLLDAWALDPEGA